MPRLNSSDELLYQTREPISTKKEPICDDLVLDKMSSLMNIGIPHELFIKKFI